MSAPLSRWIRIPGRWDIPYSYAAGEAATRFFTELRDSKRILATKCPACGRTLLPPRSFCERDFVRCDEWVEVGPQGVVETFTVTVEAFTGLREPPYVVALIKLDGSTTSLAHFLGEVDATDPVQLFDQVKRGLRVEAVFRSERVGNILDIEYFPAGYACNRMNTLVDLTLEQYEGNPTHPGHGRTPLVLPGTVSARDHIPARHQERLRRRPSLGCE